jgi:Pyridine nucleotide-disulphide oxidoreductase, dimerisation domain
MKNTISGNEGRTFMKLVVAAESQRVVGVHMVGPDCAEIMQVGVVWQRAERRPRAFCRSVLYACVLLAARPRVQTPCKYHFAYAVAVSPWVAACMCPSDWDSFHRVFCYCSTYVASAVLCMQRRAFVEDGDACNHIGFGW